MPWSIPVWGCQKVETYIDQKPEYFGPGSAGHRRAYMGWRVETGFMDAVGPLLDGAVLEHSISEAISDGGRRWLQRKVFRSGPAELIAQAVQVDNILYLSGQVGVDAAVRTDSVVEQATLAYSASSSFSEFGAT